MITGLAHICFTVSNLQRSIDFYGHKLGLKPLFEFRRDDGSQFGQYFHLGQRTFLELFEGEIDANPERPAYRHFCLEIDDIQATVAEFRKQGVEVSDPKLGNDRSWQAWLNDPDGNRIELHQYTAESKQLPGLK